jgi:hypothetical protein
MLDKQPTDIIGAILGWCRNNRDVLAVALTCKELFSFCKCTEKVWKKGMRYNKKFMKGSIGGPYVRHVIVKGNDNKNNALDILCRMEIRSLKLIYEEGDKFEPRENFWHIKNSCMNLRILVVLVHSIAIEKIRTILECSMIEQFKLRTNYIYANMNDLVAKVISKSFRMISICHMKFNKEIPKVEGSRGLEVMQITLAIDVIDILKANKGTLRHIYMNYGAAYMNTCEDLLNECTNLQYANMIHPGDIYFGNISKINKGIEVLLVNLYGIESCTLEGFLNLRVLYIFVEEEFKIDFGNLRNLEVLSIDGKMIDTKELYTLNKLKALMMYPFKEKRTTKDFEEFKCYTTYFDNGFNIKYMKDLQYISCNGITWKSKDIIDHEIIDIINDGINPWHRIAWA